MPRRVARTVLRGDRRSNAAVLPDTGYNTALLAHLIGPAGQVTTVGIDSEVVRGARECLAAAGYRSVSVFCGDGEFGYSDHRLYDRIVVIAGAWDLCAVRRPDVFLVQPGGIWRYIPGSDGLPESERRREQEHAQ